MGEARRRGTRAERKAQAEAREAARREEWRRRDTEEQAAYEAAMRSRLTTNQRLELATLMGMLAARGIYFPHAPCP